MDPKDIKDGAKGVAKAEALLKKVRERNKRFLASTGKLEDQMESGIQKAEEVWKKTEQSLKETEKEGMKAVEDAVKDFYS